MATIAFTCPQCGGPFEINEGDRNILCNFCGATSVIIGDVGYTRLLLPERIDLNAARGAVRKLLSSTEAGQAFAAGFSFEAAELLFLPFWRLRGLALGWQWREKEMFHETTENDENGRRLTRQEKGPNERHFELIAKPVDYSSPAADYSPYGMIRAGLAGAVLRCQVMDYPAAARRGTIVDPLKGIGQARLEALALARDASHGQGIVRRESRMSIVDEWPGMIYFPVWRLRFSRGGRSYHATVDAISGDVVSCRFPGPRKRETFLPLALLALLAWGWCTMAIVGAATTLAVAAFLGKRLGGLDPAGIMLFFLDNQESGKGIERG